jgi:hypothetical protein
MIAFSKTQAAARKCSLCIVYSRENRNAPILRLDRPSKQLPLLRDDPASVVINVAIWLLLKACYPILFC